MATNQRNADIACSRALDEAQRNAVEQATGVMITSTTNVENFQVKMDRILSESKGFINAYKIKSEKNPERIVKWKLKRMSAWANYATK